MLRISEQALSEIILRLLSDNGYTVERLTGSLLSVESGSGVTQQVSVTSIFPEVGRVATSSHAAIGDSMAAATEGLEEDRPSDAALWFGERDCAA